MEKERNGKVSTHLEERQFYMTAEDGSMVRSAGEQAGGLDKSARTGRYSSIQDRRRINYDVFRKMGYKNDK